MRSVRANGRSIVHASGLAAIAATIAPLAPAEQDCLPDKPFAEHRVAQGAGFDLGLSTVDTIERETGRRPAIVPAATPVQASVGKILLLTENGYTLVRP
jgi:hypothetical protein